MADLGQRPARLVIHSDRRMVREALAAYFSGERDFTVVGHTGTPHGLQTLCALGRPDVCLIDIETLSARTVRTLHELRGAFPDVEVVVTYTDLTLELLVEAVRAGVTSFVPSSRGLDVVQRLLRERAQRGRTGPPAPPNGGALTDRELGVISLLSCGHTVSDIARLLRISPHTVDNHKRRVYAKFGVGTQGMAISQAASLGILESPRTEPDSRARAGQTPLVVVSGPTGQALDRVLHTVRGRGLPLVHARGRQPLRPDHWARWHRGPIVTVLVDPTEPDWLLPASLDTVVVVVRSVPQDLPAVAGALASGGGGGRGRETPVRALVHAGDVPEDLPEVLYLVARGCLAVSAEYAGWLAAWLSGRRPERGLALPDLTAREQDVLRLLAQGQTIRQAARTLGIAAKTVENTQARLYRKLGTHTRAETLTVAYELGLLDPGVSGGWAEATTNAPV